MDNALRSAANARQVAFVARSGLAVSSENFSSTQISEPILKKIKSDRSDTLNSSIIYGIQCITSMTQTKFSAQNTFFALLVKLSPKK